MKHRLVRIAIILTALAAVAAIVAAAILYPRYRHYQEIADSFDLTEISAIPAISEVFDRTGRRYSRLQGETRYVVPLAEVSRSFQDALLAREDDRFRTHPGVDARGIIRAAITNIRSGEVEEGASTITQQLARNSFELSENRWERKIIEALLALRMERELTKDEILEAYVNRIFYGRGLYGIETASRACFGKNAKDLSLSEAAILAGLIRSPNRFSPLEDTAKAITQRDQVLARMEELELISIAEADAARAERMPAAKRLPPVVQEDYAMDAVIRDLRIVLAPDVMARGGLKIYTTIDRRLQLIAQSAVENHLAEMESSSGWGHPTRAAYDPEKGYPAYLQGSLVAIDNATGGVLAIVGGRDYRESRYNRALLAKRQVGSTFKPFIYAAAFEAGLLPGTLVDDGPIRTGEIASIKSNWSPENSDGGDAGLLPAATGLIRSRNTMAVRVGEFATLPALTALAARVGLGEIAPNPATYLGAFEATLKDITTAYTTFPSGGTRRQSFVVDRVVDRTGRTIYKATGASIQAIAPPADAITDEILRDVVTSGTAAKAKSLGAHRLRRGEDWHDRRLQGCLVHWLHEQPDVRRLGRSRPTSAHHEQRLRQHAGAPDLGRFHRKSLPTRFCGWPSWHRYPSRPWPALPPIRTPGHARLPGLGRCLRSGNPKGDDARQLLRPVVRRAWIDDHDRSPRRVGRPGAGRSRRRSAGREGDTRRPGINVKRAPGRTRLSRPPSGRRIPL